MKISFYLKTILAKDKRMKDPQFKSQKLDSTSILKDYFSWITYPSIFTPVEPELFDWSNKTSLLFLALNTKNHTLS